MGEGRLKRKSLMTKTHWRRRTWMDECGHCCVTGGDTQDVKVEKPCMLIAFVDTSGTATVAVIVFAFSEPLCFASYRENKFDTLQPSRSNQGTECTAETHLCGRRMRPTARTEPRPATC
jgi:hypothetical protein